MGNKSQLKILLGGAQNWNAWRQANPDVPIDSHGEDIGHATLGIDDQASLAGEPFGNNAWSFIRAEWIGYVCWPVDFSGANLQGARLTNATGCLLATADLRGANLEHTS